MTMGRLGQVLLAMALFALVLGGCKRETPASRDSATAQAPLEGSAAPGGHVFDPEDQWGLVGSPVKGSEQALVTIVEFSEFQCPFCSRVLPTLTQILDSEEFAGKVRVVFKNLPLDFHDRAMPAARAAWAAHQQGKFWEFHDLLFANQREGLGDENFTAYAQQLGLDMERFAADMASPETQARLDADVAVATRLGIRGTPNFLINGRPLTGAQPFDQFATVIREEITAMQGLIDSGKSVSQAYGERVAANQAAAPRQDQQAQQRPARPTPDPADELYVPVGQSAFKGSADALVTIVEFSEFQCPFCARVGPTLAQVVERYGNDVRIVFKHNPLSFHDRAPAAARAAIAAQNQGKFWEYHDLLFENQRALEDADLERYAEQVGLDMERFRRDIAAPETQARIDEDMALAQRLQAGGTPHFFVNGTRLRGAQPFEQFQRVIDAELEEARALVTAGTARAGVYDALQADANRGPARMIQPPAAPQGEAAPAAPREPVTINVTDEPFLGSANAPLTMVIYSDYTCGYCKRFHTTVYEAHEGYQDRVRVVFKQFPRGADTLAVAAWAAHQQGQFWPYSDRLMEGGISDRDAAINLARELGLNVDRFTADMDASTTRERVAAQKAEGQGFGVRGTPTWYLNGVQSVGAYDTARLRAAWDQALAALPAR